MDASDVDKFPITCGAATDDSAAGKPIAILQLHKSSLLHDDDDDDGERQPQVPQQFYDPHDYGKPDGIGCGAAVVHLVRGSLGICVLLMPFSVHKLGYVTGSLTFVFTSFAYYHVVRRMVYTEYRLCRRLKLQNLSYVELTGKMFELSPWPVCELRVAAQRLLYAFYCIPVSNASFLLVMADAVRALVALFDARVTATHVISAVVVPLTFICTRQRILKILVPFSSVTNGCTLLMVAVMVTSSLTRATPSTPTTPATPAPFGPIGQVPASVAFYSQIFCCGAMSLALKAEMREPRQLTSAWGGLNAAALVTTALHLCFGVVMCFSYGDEVRENVISNMPPNHYVTHVVNALFAASISVAYLLTFSARFHNIWSGPFKRTFVGCGYESVAEYGVRIGYNVFAYLLAVAVPNVALMATVAGSLNMVVDTVLAVCIELLYTVTYEKTRYGVIFKDVCILGVCSIVLAVSFGQCVKQIIQLYSA